MEKDLQSLKSNPIFQLSLASKELFHSNFLYWLSQDENLKGLFKDIIDNLCGDNKIVWGELKDGFVVLREYKNFDLCICKKKSTQTNNGSSEGGNEIKNIISTDEKLVEDSDPNYDDIQQAGEIVFVLENKFKSIATAGQLRKYVEKTLEYNVPIFKKSVVSENNGGNWSHSRDYGSLDKKIKDSKTKTKFVLLTLAKDFAEIDAIKEIDTFYCDKDGKIVEPNNGNDFISKDNKWIIRSYEDYAQFLSNSLLDINDEKLTTFNVSFQIIFNYIRFIRTFSLEINKHLGDIKLTDNWNSIFEEKNKEYKSIRCSDIWQKMAMHKIAQELMGRVNNIIQSNPEFEIDTDSSDKHCRECLSNDNKFSKTIFIGVQYFHSLALLEIKYRIGDDCMFVIQQQGNSLCAGIDILQNRNNYLNKSRKDNNWSDIVDDRLFQGFNLIYILDNSGNIFIEDNNTYEVKVLKDTIKIISNKSNGEIPAYENEKGGFYYKNIILNPSNKSKDNGNSTINDTLDYMVECLKRAIIIYPPQK